MASQARLHTLRYQKQTSIKELRILNGRNPKSGVAVLDSKELDQIKLDWQEKMGWEVGKKPLPIIKEADPVIEVLKT